ncbi:Uncharacterised protein [Escherichia coli]|nr:Uncharacterised protein [Escherichia coli]
MKKQVCLLLSGLLLAGCAGQHHRPPAGMAGNFTTAGSPGMADAH